MNAHSTIKQAILTATERLKPTSLSPRVDAETLLAHVLCCSRVYLFTYPEQLLTDQQQSAFSQLLNSRIEGVPVAYLTGVREFWSLAFCTSKATLIPRPETERLVELALEHLKNKEQARILDLGTGTGAIALSLASEKPNWAITATDVSVDALSTARLNAQRLNLPNVTFIQSDWFANIPQNQTFDAIISNPPYIAEGDPHLFHGDVRFEPQSALVSGKNGLIDIKHIVQSSHEYLAPEGLLLIEHGYDQKDAVVTLLRNAGYHQVTCWQDYQGCDRVSGGLRW